MTVIMSIYIHIYIYIDYIGSRSINLDNVPTCIDVWTLWTRGWMDVWVYLNPTYLYIKYKHTYTPLASMKHCMKHSIPKKQKVISKYLYCRIISSRLQEQSWLMLMVEKQKNMRMISPGYLPSVLLISRL